MKEENRLYLKVPSYDELWYRKELLGDPKTMEYNKGYEIQDESYNYNNGTYDFDERYWDEWYTKWAGNQQEKFYAYLVRKIDNKFIGEVSFDIDHGKSDMNLLIESAARGLNYSKDALDLITKEAFVNRKVDLLADFIPESKMNVIDTYKKYGFKTKDSGSKIKKFGELENVFEVSYSKTEYDKNNKKGFLGFFVKNK